MWNLKEVRDTVVSLHAMKAYWESGVSLLLFFTSALDIGGW